MDIYYKKVFHIKIRRIIGGMRENEKHLKLNEILILFLVAYIEKL